MPAPDLDTPTPLEAMLRAELPRIADEEGRIPPERELAARFGVGRTRLRRALAALEGEGLLFRTTGRAPSPCPRHCRAAA